MKNKLRYIPITAVIILSTLGCKKGHLDINKNPNAIVTSDITSSLILPFALHNAGAQVTGFQWLNNWMGYWSPSGSFAPNTEESTYNITGNFGQARWDNTYNMLYDFHTVEQKAPQEGFPFYAGIAKVMKARYFQDLVDIFGDVPYSQAFQIDKFATPKYDKGEDIYKNLQIQLDSAINIFTKAAPSQAATVDIMFQGNTAKWTRFANTLKLRLLIRQSEIPGFNPSTEIAKILSNGGVLQSGENASVNPGYANEAGKQNPFYATVGFTATGAIASEIVRGNNHIITILKNTSDPRIGRFFKPAATPTNANDPYVGTVYGSPSNDAFNGQKTSTLGPGLNVSASQSQWVLTSVESLFLYAEAVARGWIAGNAQTAYENAVRESFIWLGVPNAVTAANTYMANNTIANWANAGATVSERVKFIVYQKYIALTSINSLEAWSDYRRLNVPSNIPLSVNPGRIGTGLPVRLLYPTTESAVNSANVPGSINQFTSRIFWDVN
ncbi:MAG TPA: SusD/RagB family nutrient-binding outer membrane lipoprotein [Segetibacter sp.]|jgi:hypothetical protein